MKEKDEGVPELELMLREDARKLVKHALDQGVPAQWYFHHLQGHVFRATITTSSDVDWLLSRGEEARRYYDEQIKELTRRREIFGKEKSD